MPLMMGIRYISHSTPIRMEATCANCARKCIVAILACSLPSSICHITNDL